MRRFVDDRQGGRRLLFGLIVIVVLLVVDFILIVLAMRVHDGSREVMTLPDTSPTAVGPISEIAWRAALDEGHSA